MKINMVTGQKSISKLLHIKNLGGMGTQAPILKKELEERGYEVDIDGKGFDYDIIHIHTPLVGLLYIQQIKKKGIPLVIHARHIPELVLKSFKAAVVLYHAFVEYSKWYYNKANVVICATPYVKNVLLDLGTSTEIRIIPNSISRERFYPDLNARKRFRKTVDVDEDEPLVLSVGLRIERKGIFTFVEAARILDYKGKYRFLWVGKGEMGLSVVKVEKDMPSNIEFLEYVPFEWMNDVYNGADIFLFPTYAESYGNVLFEAAAAGKPLILRDIPVYKEWFRHNENCLKCETNAEFIKAIEAISSDTALRQRLIKGSLRLAEEHDLNKALDSLCTLYKDITENRR